MNAKRTISILLAFLLVVATGVAQPWPDSKGRDFWFTFLPNFHNAEDDIATDPLLQRQHQLYIYIGAERPTTGTITFRNALGQTRTQSFTITDVRQLYSTSIYYRDQELRGISNNGDPFNYTTSDNENVAPQSIHITANDDVTVYALNQANLTSDAFLVLPTDALAEDYVIASYNSDVTKTGSTQQVSTNSTPSQFAVVATDDSTIVYITPRVQTPRNARRKTDTVYLEKGDSYLVQADLRVGVDPDLTGSLVRATKPVAVFAGHHRALLPLSSRGTLASRDCLVEQMNPIRTWGKSAFIIPFVQASDEIDAGSDIMRVVAAFDSTEVIIDGVLRRVINAGQFYEEGVTGAKEVETSRPSMVAQYKKSSGAVSQFDFTRNGDPFMMLVPPAEQFMDAYRFISIQSYIYARGPGGQPIVVDSIYKEQWLNIVIPSTGIASLTLDGAPVNPGVFSFLAGGRYAWARIRMSDGVHAIQSDTTFGIYVYGYGLANSYGYIGGMAFRPLDVNPPVVIGEIKCHTFEGAVTDSVIADTRVVSVATIPGTEQNVTVAVPQFTPPQAVVALRVGLQDVYLDGSVVIEAVDGVEQETRDTINVPGFTVAEQGLRTSRVVRTYERIVPVGRERCDSVEVENYGRYAQTFTASFAGGTRISNVQPITLAPGERTWIRFCHTGISQRVVVDTLRIDDSCIARPILAMILDERLDEKGPTILDETEDSCASDRTIIIEDETGADLGLMSARVLDDVLENCAVVLTDSTIRDRRFRVTILDPYRDAIVGFEAVDSALNVTRRIDTIPGFELQVDGDTSVVTTHDFGIVQMSLLECDTLDLSNTGVRSISLPSVYIQDNALFSAPLSQFAVSIASVSGSAKLVVCFAPVAADTSLELTDTLELRQGCLVRKIVLTGRGSSQVFSGISRCDVPVGTRTQRKLGAIQIVPQPAGERATIVLAEPAQHIRVQLLDLAGAVLLDRSLSESTSAQAVDLALDEVPAGLYACVVTTEHGVSQTLCIVR